MKKNILILAIFLLSANINVFAQEVLPVALLRYTQTQKIINRYGNEVKKTIKHTISFSPQALKTTMQPRETAYFTTISNFKNQSTKSYVTDLEQFYVMEDDYKNYFFDLGQYNQVTPEISLLKDTLTIKNFLCNRAILNYLIAGEKCSIDVWYYKGYKVKNKKISNPFEQLDGIPVMFSYVDKPKMMIANINMNNKSEYLLDTLSIPDASSITAIENAEKYVEISGVEKLTKVMGIMQNRKNAGSIASPKGEPISETHFSRDSTASLVMTAYNPFKLGEKMVDFKGLDEQGIQVQFSDFKNRIVVINFWFIKCAPCVYELPLLNKVVNKYPSDKVGFLSITFDRMEDVQAFLRKTDFKFQKMVDAKSVIEKMGVSSYPTTVIVDKNGEIKFIKVSSFASEKELEVEIEKLLQ